MKRRRITVRWSKADRTWLLLDQKLKRPLLYGNKSWVLMWGRIRAKDRQPSQLVVFNKSGRIGFEHTYPRSSDPRRYKG